MRLAAEAESTELTGFEHNAVRVCPVCGALALVLALLQLNFPDMCRSGSKMPPRKMANAYGSFTVHAAEPWCILDEMFSCLYSYLRQALLLASKSSQVAGQFMFPQAANTLSQPAGEPGGIAYSTADRGSGGNSGTAFHMAGRRGAGPEAVRACARFPGRLQTRHCCLLRPKTYS